MGVFGNLLLQAFVTSVVLGVLKRAGVVRVNPTAIENPTLRAVFEQALDLGETVAEKGQKVIDGVTKL